MKSGLICTQCGSQFPVDEVAVSTNVTMCRRCGQKWNYAELVAANAAENLDPQIPQTPPPGAWCRELPPRGFEAGFSMRSRFALVLILFTCVWSGLTLWGTYGIQIANRHFSLKISLLGIPFVIGTVILVYSTVMVSGGKITVTVNGDEGVVFKGIGPFGRRRRFNWRRVTAIRETLTIRSGRQITIYGEKEIHIGGTGFQEERFNFLLGVLRKKLRETDHTARPMVGE